MQNDAFWGGSIDDAPHIPNDYGIVNTGTNSSKFSKKSIRRNSVGKDSVIGKFSQHLRVNHARDNQGSVSRMSSAQVTNKAHRSRKKRLAAKAKVMDNMKEINKDNKSEKKKNNRKLKAAPSKALADEEFEKNEDLKIFKIMEGLIYRLHLSEKETADQNFKWGVMFEKWEPNLIYSSFDDVIPTHKIRKIKDQEVVHQKRLRETKLDMIYTPMDHPHLNKKKKGLP